MTSKAFELARLSNAYSDGALSNRNLIINGAMQVAQRGTSATGITTSSWNTLDRWHTNGNNGTWTMSQETTGGPDGFSNSMKFLLTATEAIGNTSYWSVETLLEGQNLQHLAYGSSAAKTVTVSFWVKSNITGTYCVNLYQDDGSSNFPKTYTIDTADTWEYKTLSYTGNTATALDNDNLKSLRTMFFLVAGSDMTSGSTGSRAAYTNATFAAGHSAQIDAVNDYWQITGVQLEIGDTSTPFEHRSYSDQLQACQRYFETNYDDGTALGSVVGNSITYGVSYRATSATNNYYSVPLKVIKRSAPTITIYNGVTGATGTWRGSSNTDRAISANSNVGFININGPANGDFIRSGFFAADAEL